MKKYTTLLVFGLIFSGFLAAQILFSFTGLHAVPVSKESGQHARYEEVFKTASFTTTDGKKFELSKVTTPIVILNFWASWCRPCLEEFPSLVQMKKNFTDDQVLVIGINSDEEDQLNSIKKIQKKYEFNFPVVPDKNGDIANLFMLSAIPVSIIFHKGKVVEVGQGSKDFASGEMTQKLSTWLK